MNMLNQIKKLDPRYIGDRIIEIKYGSERNKRKSIPYYLALLGEVTAVGGLIFKTWLYAAPKIPFIRELFNPEFYKPYPPSALVAVGIPVSLIFGVSATALLMRGRIPEIMDPSFYELEQQYKKLEETKLDPVSLIVK